MNNYNQWNNYFKCRKTVKKSLALQMKEVNITGLTEKIGLPINRTYRNQGKECSVFALKYVFKALKNIFVHYWNKIYGTINRKVHILSYILFRGS